MAKYLRRVLRVSAEDSPNVKLAREQQARGEEPTGEVVVPGVLTWSEYLLRERTWSEYRKCVGLRGLFYEGAQLMLFPPIWLDRATRAWDRLRTTIGTTPTRAIGIDSGEGGANTVWAAVNEWGLKDLKSMKTPDTSVILGETLAFVRRHDCPADRVVFDRGGGGLQFADLLRRQGHPVRTVGFGESVSLELRRGLHTLATRKEAVEDRYAYVNRRAEMYGELSLLLDPSVTLPDGGEKYWGLPPESQGEQYERLWHQMLCMPRCYDGEGRLYLPSKTKKNSEDTRQTLTDIVGYSPDELDAVVLAVHGMLHRAPVSQVKVG